MISFQRIEHSQDYLPQAGTLTLGVASRLITNQAGIACRECCVSDQVERLEQLCESAQSIAEIAAELGVAVLDFSKPWLLQPVHIAKPWGQEIWYSGMEARGISTIASATGTTPLPWAIAVSRQGVLGIDQHQVNLLKILDPLPEPVFGDLYFELHEEKREVYIVTHVDPAVQGNIRLGFSQTKRAAFADDQAFKAAYLADVASYRAVREQIDGKLDQLRLQAGVALNEPVAAEQLKVWLAQIESELTAREIELRAVLDSYSELSPLTVGDVVAVPLLTPHSLQHGVRTVEFQTPVYERKILSFAQKVLTQSHWDTAEALELARLDVPPQPEFPLLHEEPGVRIEAIVEFEDFCVQRIFLEPGVTLAVPTMMEYVLLMSVASDVQVDSLTLAKEQACLVPAACSSVVLTNRGSSQAIVLAANPVSHERGHDDHGLE